MIEIIGISVSAIIAIGVAVYQVKTSKQNLVSKRITKSLENLWKSLNEMRAYFDIGMQSEINKSGNLSLKPVQKFIKIVNHSKPNIDADLYRDLNMFYKKFASFTNINLFEPMKQSLEQKTTLSESELKNIEFKINKNRLKVIKMIEEFMEQNKNQFNYK